MYNKSLWCALLRASISKFDAKEHFTAPHTILFYQHLIHFIFLFLNSKNITQPNLIPYFGHLTVRNTVPFPLAVLSWCAIQFSVFYKMKLQSRTLNLGHTALVPASLPSNVVLQWFFGRIAQVRAQHWKEEGKGRRAQLVDVIPSIDPSSNVTNCRKVVDFAFFWEYKNHWTNSHFYKGH